MSEAATATNKRKVTDAVEARVEMINGMFDLPDATREAMKHVRAATETAARAVRAAVEAAPAHDKGRLIAALDALQAAKNVACDALILPHAVVVAPVV